MAGNDEYLEEIRASHTQWSIINAPGCLEMLTEMMFIAGFIIIIISLSFHDYDSLIFK